MPVRTQIETQVTFGASYTQTVNPDGVIDWSDDFTFDEDMVAAMLTIEGNSSGASSDDIVDVYMAVKKDPDNSNSGTPDTYDTQGSFVFSLNCASGGDEQRSELIPKAFPGNKVRFGCKNAGTNGIGVGLRVTEDLFTP